MCPQIPYATDHGVIPLLQGYVQDGCPVDCGKNWTREHMEVILERGPHKSSNGKKAVRQISQETEDKVKHQYARVGKWGDTKNDIPLKLKSPL